MKKIAPKGMTKFLRISFAIRFSGWKMTLPSFEEENKVLFEMFRQSEIHFWLLN